MARTFEAALRSLGRFSAKHAETLQDEKFHLILSAQSRKRMARVGWPTLSQHVLAMNSGPWSVCNYVLLLVFFSGSSGEVR